MVKRRSVGDNAKGEKFLQGGKNFLSCGGSTVEERS
jgi:hypothetical protein